MKKVKLKFLMVQLLSAGKIFHELTNKGRCLQYRIPWQGCNIFCLASVCPSNWSMDFFCLWTWMSKPNWALLVIFGVPNSAIYRHVDMEVCHPPQWPHWQIFIGMIRKALYHHSYVGPPPPMQISMHPSQGTRSSQKEAIVPWFLFGIPLFYHSTRKCNNFHCFLSKVCQVNSTRCFQGAEIPPKIISDWWWSNSHDSIPHFS